ncbi:hypothetical protein L2725_18375 [Shewanella corallii]|uniref:Lipoprotein n=2 Tax=Shewanella TaxID=22 RepID=A0ABT0NBC1_9GAMM|nr:MULTISPECIES: hypothetical protein [Shewanella]MCL1036597.1 hypothetical protein [Shewanella submarina]MCL2915724.1 hypothetical protein [Shewanella corallii]
MRIILLITAMLAAFITTGCSDDIQGPPSTPELTSRGFFEAIYVDRNVKQAEQYVDVSIKELLQHYRIASSVQRHMLNLSMTDVTIEIMEVDLDFFRKFSDSTTVVVKLTGRKNGQKWKDDRTLRLEKRKGIWVITEIVPEKLR